MSIHEMLKSAEDGMNLFIEEAAQAGDEWDESKHKRGRRRQIYEWRRGYKQRNN